MEIDKDFKGLKNVGWRYEYDGDIKTDESLVIDLDMGLYVSGSIKAGGYIEAGEDYGISAGLYITCKGVLKFGLKCFAGVCTWRKITNEEKTITCGKLEGGVIGHGILKEIGEAIELLKLNGYKLTKE